MTDSDNKTFDRSQKVRFIRDFFYVPSAFPRQTTEYHAGNELRVNRECATLALAAGACEILEKDVADATTSERGADAPSNNAAKARGNNQ